MQSNNDKYVLLVVEQSPYPGEENTHSYAAGPLQPPGPPGLSHSGRREGRDAPEPQPLFLGTGERPKPRPQILADIFSKNK